MERSHVNAAKFGALVEVVYRWTLSIQWMPFIGFEMSLDFINYNILSF